MLGTGFAYFLGGYVRIGREIKTPVTAGRGNLVSLFHLYIVNHFTEGSLGCIDTAQDCSKWATGMACVLF